MALGARPCPGKDGGGWRPGILTTVALLGVMITASQVAAAAPEPAPTSLGQQALATCDTIDDQPTAAARPTLEKGLAQAEQAVAANDRDPKAHLAVFCNLAKLTYLDGFSVRSLFAVWRLRQEVDKALELSPDYADALIAKGGLLLNLPRVLGGDPQEAERVLRRAVELEPERVLPRLHLAEALSAIGAREQAEAQARYALALAERKGRADQVVLAQTLIARLEKGE